MLSFVDFKVIRRLASLNLAVDNRLLAEYIYEIYCGEVDIVKAYESIE